MVVARCLASLVLSVAALPALAEVPKVATDIPPVHSIVASVMGDLGEPVLLLEQGANAHNYQMRPSQAQALADAGLVVWMGPDMTPWLERSLEGNSDTESLALLEVEGTFLREYGDIGGHDHAENEHAHEGEETAEAGHDHGEEDHAHTGIDPHAWLDPANATLWLDVVAAQLSELDPANAAAYAANAEAEKARIAELDGAIAAQLEPVHDRPMVVFHDAYGYFADHYGLTVAGTVALGDAADPGAARLAELRETLASVVCIFPEAQHDPKMIETLAEGTGVRIGGTLDPEGRTLAPGPDLYRTLMSDMADTVAGCLAPA